MHELVGKTIIHKEGGIVAIVTAVRFKTSGKETELYVIDKWISENEFKRMWTVNQENRYSKFQ